MRGAPFFGMQKCFSGQSYRNSFRMGRVWLFSLKNPARCRAGRLFFL